ncbi:MAG: tetratricopeptide repeat protein [Planctomycetota bacterium]
MRLCSFAVFVVAVGCTTPRVAPPSPGPLRASTAAPDSAVSPDPASSAIPRLERALALLEDGDLAAAEPLLRSELAAGGRPEAAGLALARALCALELHDEAIAVLLAARDRSPTDLELRAAIVRTLADLDLLTEAELEWSQWVEEEGAPPEAWLLGATLALEVGDGARAIERLGRLTGPVSPEFAAVAEELREAAAALDRGTQRGVPPRRLLAVLRGDAPAAERLSAFRALARSPTHRPFALTALLAHAGPDLLAAGLAAIRLESEDCRLLSGGLDAEDSPRRFRVLHDALVRALGPAVDLVAEGEFEPSERARVARSWSKLCPK